MSQTSRSIQLAPSHSGTAEGTAGSRLVDKHPHGEPLAGLDRGQQINQAEPMLGIAIVQIVDASDVDQQIELPLVFQKLERR